MRNLALIIITVLGTSAASFAQDGTKQTEPTKMKLDKTPQPMKTQNGGSRKKRDVAPKKEEAPAKKVN